MASSTDGKHVPHVVPLWILIGVLAILLVLTWATVAVTSFDFGSNLNLVVAMVIAVIKAALVVMFFMHLVWDRPFNTVIFVSALAFVGLFIILALLDTGQYQPTMIPGYTAAGGVVP